MKTFHRFGRSSGLVVIRGDSCPRGVSSNPSIRYLMYNFSHLLDVKYYCCFKRPKIYEKEACNVPFYEKNNRWRIPYPAKHQMLCRKPQILHERCSDLTGKLWSWFHLCLSTLAAFADRKTLKRKLNV